MHIISSVNLQATTTSLVEVNLLIDFNTGHNTEQEKIQLSSMNLMNLKADNCEIFFDIVVALLSSSQHKIYIERKRLVWIVCAKRLILLNNKSREIG